MSKFSGNVSQISCTTDQKYHNKHTLHDCQKKALETVKGRNSVYSPSRPSSQILACKQQQHNRRSQSRPAPEEASALHAEKLSLTEGGFFFLMDYRNKGKGGIKKTIGQKKLSKCLKERYVQLKSKR